MKRRCPYCGQEVPTETPCGVCRPGGPARMVTSIDKGASDETVVSLWEPQADGSMRFVKFLSPMKMSRIFLETTMGEKLEVREV